MVVNQQFILENYPLHHYILNNDTVEVAKLLQDPEFRKEHLEKVDPRGRTPLIISVLKGNLAMIDLLLNKYNADATFTQEDGWNVIHEAISTKNKNIIRMVLARRDIQRCEQQEKLVPDLLHELKNAPDFYVEMKWEFSTWLPFVNRMLPPGQWHRVYKLGSSLRVDSSSTENGWDEGVSVIFKEEGKDIFILEIDHAVKQVLKQIICSNNPVSNGGGKLSTGKNYEQTIMTRLVNPSVSSVMDWKTVSFQRKEGYLGTEGSIEEVNGFKCKVFQSSGFGLLTKFRTEHLSEMEKSKMTLEEKPGLLKRMMSYVSKYEIDNRSSEPDGNSKGKKGQSNSEFSPEEYFDKNQELNRDVGPTKEVKSKRVKLDATLWICEEYPLNIKEQLVPIVNIMALTNSRFRSLKDFIELQMPSGFPVKLEVPVYHFVNGLITFHNIFGSQCKIDGVTALEENGRLTCVLNENLFEPPPSYDMKIAICFGPNLSREDDDFFGIFRDADPNEPQVDIYEALNAPRTLVRDNTPDDDAEEQILQRVIEESLVMERLKSDPEWRPSGDGNLVAGASAFPLESRDFPRSSSYEELEKALALSRAETEEVERSQKEEEEMLRKVLEMSLKDF